MKEKKENGRRERGGREDKDEETGEGRIRMKKME